jgi:uncharacterized membrane protein
MVAAALLPQIVARWARLYADNKAVSTSFTYLHLAGVLVGGGFAVAADRAALRLSREQGAHWSRDLASLTTVHRWVIAGLALTFVSGLFMMLADLGTFLPSVVFWTKMGLIVLLIANGYLKLRAEAALQNGVVPAWRRLRRTAVMSLVLWFVVLLAGTILTAAA